MDLVGFHGVGLRSGNTCSVILSRVPGPLTFVANGVEWHRETIRPQIVGSRLGVALPGGREVDGLAPLLAALAGLGIQHGIRVDIEGPELPLLDGGSRELALALRALAPPRDAPRLRVVQSGEVIAGTSRFSFEPGASGDVAVTVAVAEGTTDQQRAAWSGSPQAFIAELASARLYDSSAPDDRSGFRHAPGAAPDTVLVLHPDGQPPPADLAPRPDELARHRLLDLLADLYLFGGPPLGKIRCWQPEHGATHHAIRQALEFGLLAHRR